MKNRLTSLLTAVVLTMSLVPPLATPQAVVVADGPGETALAQRYYATGQYNIVAAGIGLNGTENGNPEADRTMALDVPGDDIVQAYLYWSGYDAHSEAGDLDYFDEMALAVDGGAADSVTADDSFGPTLWLDSAGEDPDYYHFVFIADVTNIIELGNHEYTFSGEGLEFYENHGAGLIVVYEDATLPESRVVINDGLDSFRYDFTGSRGPNSEVTYFDFSAADHDRDVDVILMASGVNADNQPYSLWYQTGDGSKPVNLVDEVSAAEFIPSPPPYPLTGADGAEWDTFVSDGEITVSAGDTWLGLQGESIDSDDPQGAGVVLITAGFVDVLDKLSGHCTTTDDYTVCTDKEDYAPEETVLVSGCGFEPNTELTIRVVRPDDSVMTGDGSFRRWPKSYDMVTTDG